MEDVFTESAIQAALPNIAKRCDFNKIGRAPWKVVDEDAGGWCKNWNRKVAAKMTLEEIRSADELGELLKAVTAIANRIDENA